jgi:glyoxylase-like metal-dependent hydrolase (beta-lactamase superfamily II)
VPVSFTAGDARLVRVPYFDVPLEATVVGLTSAQVLDVPWAVPAWATSDGRALVGQAVWVIEAGGEVIVVDPCGAADAFLRTGPEAITHQEAVLAAMEVAGYAAGRIDKVILSHLDGIGMAAGVGAGDDGSPRWFPLFPKATLVLSAAELAWVRTRPEVQGAGALAALNDLGVVEAVDAPWEAAAGVVLEVSGGHSPGHAVVRVGEDAVFIGHLAISPLNAATRCPGVHQSPEVALAALERELASAAERQRLVIGPLWPEPGAARVSGPPWIITPATPA